MSEAPLVVVDGPGPGFDAAVAEIRDAGWTVSPQDGGWRVAPRGGSVVVLAGRVASPGDAAMAVLAAARGYGLVALVEAPGEVLEHLVEDLRRIGPVEARRGDLPPAPATSPRLDEEQQVLLDLLAAGASLGEAAAQLHVSRRTAARRLASARTALGVGSTAQAVIASRRGGAAG